MGRFLFVVLAVTLAVRSDAFTCSDGSSPLNLVCMGSAPLCAGECTSGQTSFGTCTTGASCGTGSKLWCGQCPEPAPVTNIQTQTQYNTNNGNGNVISTGSGGANQKSSDASYTKSKAFNGFRMIMMIGQGLLALTIAARSYY
jgi:hypothetical protein